MMENLNARLEQVRSNRARLEELLDRDYQVPPVLLDLYWETRDEARRIREQQEADEFRARWESGQGEMGSDKTHSAPKAQELTTLWAPGNQQSGPIATNDGPAAGENHARERENAGTAVSFPGKGGGEKRRIYEQLTQGRYPAAQLVEQSGGVLTLEDVLAAKEGRKLPLGTWQLIELAMGLLDGKSRPASPAERVAGREDEHRNG